MGGDQTGKTGVSRGMRFWIAILAFGCLCRVSCSSIDPNAVLILVNSSEEDSVELGYYYASKRQVPSENIVQVSTLGEETITWDNYIDQIYNPLMSLLLAGDWLDGFDSDRTDELGRRKRLIDSHRIEALVVCKGIPLRIANDPVRLPPQKSTAKNSAGFHTNRGSVDSELAAIPFPGSRIDSFYPNPFFQRTRSKNLFDLKPLVVGRLDGPSYLLARELVDNAIQAEKDGIAGRAYVDIHGPHEVGDQWFETTVEVIEKLGFETSVHRAEGRFNLVDRFDDPLLYFGWYAGGIDGPFTHYGFEFPVGAIALHIHSSSASTVRSGHKHWVGPFLARGITATFGNTSEPYLYFTHQPHIFLDGLIKGLTAGEAALYSIPSLSWAGVFFGDPLYRPPLTLRSSPKNEYEVLRTANLARQAGDAAAYKAVLEEHNRTHHFSTGLWLCDYFLELDDSEKAYEYLGSMHQPSMEDFKNWGVLLKIAEAYLRLNDPRPALRLFEDMLKRSSSKRELREQLLRRLVALASEYQLEENRDQWQRELDRWTPVQENNERN